MKAWLKAATFISLTIAIIMVVAFAIPTEPEYQGKTLTTWTADIEFTNEFLGKTNLALAVYLKQEAAVAAIRHIGTKALPTALNLCSAKDPWYKEKIEDYCNDRNFNTPFVDDQQKHEAGQKIIWSLGPIAKPLIPDLIQLFQFQGRNAINNAPAMACYALRGIGTNAIPDLIQTFTNEELIVEFFPGGFPCDKEYSSRALGLFKGDARGAVPALLASLQSPYRSVRELAAVTLGDIGQNAETVVPVLLNSLNRETNQYVVGAISGALEEFDRQPNNCCGHADATNSPHDLP